MTFARSVNEIALQIHKHYTVEGWQHFMNNGGNEIRDYLMISTGVSQADLEKTDTVRLVSNQAVNKYKNFILCSL